MYKSIILLHILMNVNERRHVCSWLTRTFVWHDHFGTLFSLTFPAIGRLSGDASCKYKESNFRVCLFHFIPLSCKFIYVSILCRHVRKVCVHWRVGNGTHILEIHCLTGRIIFDVELGTIVVSDSVYRILIVQYTLFKDKIKCGHRQGLVRSMNR